MENIYQLYIVNVHVEKYFTPTSILYEHNNNVGVKNVQVVYQISNILLKDGWIVNILIIYHKKLLKVV